jgi:beta-1,4-mannosyl-glycoprotein beta-1,4-N-acetylglucosaminyltransferase
LTLWSATPYCGEADVLEIRLGTLEGVVDRHVIVEGNRTQRGRAKPFYFQEQRDRFARWEDSITYLAFNLEGAPGEGNDWRRERNLRDGITLALELEPGDLVFLSDLDEIPRPELLRPCEDPLRFQMNMHLYYLNWRWREQPVQNGTRATLCPARTLSELRPAQIVEAGWPVHGESAGWHLAYQDTAAGIQRKVLSIADDFRAPEFLDLRHLEHCRKTGEDLFKRSWRRCEWAPDEELPPYVLENRDHFAHMLIPEPA